MTRFSSLISLFMLSCERQLHLFLLEYDRKKNQEADSLFLAVLITEAIESTKFSKCSIS